MASFERVDTTLGNIETAIAGAHRKIGPGHAARYLASFAWRHHRRYHLQTVIPRFRPQRRTDQPHALSIPRRWMRIWDKREINSLWHIAGHSGT